eukprot:TRINITY_DN12210_c0_g1_i5.p1 TRINITY_DN12210_c0_g1~~TRINITY_DN12210_c0_g1_i5.p1  ORF type:complete len:232 (+),score=37.19 TRINITY_DN12210_c0_g1_i5:63-758(+)
MMIQSILLLVALQAEQLGQIEKEEVDLVSTWEENTNPCDGWQFITCSLVQNKSQRVTTNFLNTDVVCCKYLDGSWDTSPTTYHTVFFQKALPKEITKMYFIQDLQLGEVNLVQQFNWLERRSSLGCNSGGTNGGRKSKSEDKVCNNCGTRKTPFWRKDKIDGHPLCNACGLYFSKNDAPRPAILWKNNEDTNDQQKNNNNNNNIGMKTEPVLPIVQPMVQTIQYAGLFQIL